MGPSLATPTRNTPAKIGGRLAPSVPRPGTRRWRDAIELFGERGLRSAGFESFLRGPGRLGAALDARLGSNGIRLVSSSCAFDAPQGPPS